MSGSVQYHMALKKKSALSRLIEKPVNVRELVDALRIKEEELEEAALEQSALFWEASRYRILKMRKRAKASFEYDRAFAEQRLRGRKKKSEDGKKSLTEGAVSDMALCSDDIDSLRKAMDDAYAYEELSKQLVECFKQRKDMIRSITTLRASEMSSDLRSTRTKMNLDEVDKMRRKVRERVDALADDDD